MRVKVSQLGKVGEVWVNPEYVVTAMPCEMNKDKCYVRVKDDLYYVSMSFDDFLEAMDEATRC